MIEYCKLPLYFDATKMQKDISFLEQTHWSLHYNKSNYQGNWSAIPLYALNGNPDSIHSIHSNTPSTATYLPTEYLASCPYIQTVLESFQFPLLSVRLMRLDAGAHVKEHTDYQLSYEEGEVRIHIPIITNSMVEFFLCNERIIMDEGECWYLNLTLPHKVYNHSNTDRIHLVIDGKVNPWMEQLFKSVDEKVTKMHIPKEPTYNHETNIKVIEELRRLGTPIAIKLANQLQNNITDN